MGTRQATKGRWEPKQCCIGFPRQGRKVFSGAGIRNLPTVSGDERKIKTLRIQPKGRDLWVSFSARAAEPGTGHGRALATMSPAVCRP